MEFTLEDHRAVTSAIYQDVRVWAYCSRNAANERRIQRIAEVIWPVCEEKAGKVPHDELHMACKERLEKHANYKDMTNFERTGFIPVWLLGIIINIIVKLVIDYFFLKTRRRVAELERQ